MKYPVTQDEFRTPGGKPVWMAYRKFTNDWNTLHASLDEDEYGLPRGLSGFGLDVGGYLGSVGIALALDNPDLEVTIVEPVPWNVTLIRRNLVLNGLEDAVKVIEGAVGFNRPVRVGFAYTGSSAIEHHAYVGNSTLASGEEYPHESVTYPPTRLEEFGHIAVLKIDCEGGEWDFLRGPVANVDLILGEWHPVHGYRQWMLLDLLADTHEVTFTGPVAGPGGFRAVRR
jgi:FkbM family methyltransferase